MKKQSSIHKASKSQIRDHQQIYQFINKSVKIMLVHLIKAPINLFWGEAVSRLWKERMIESFRRTPTPENYNTNNDKTITQQQAAHKAKHTSRLMRHTKPNTI